MTAQSLLNYFELALPRSERGNPAVNEQSKNRSAKRTCVDLDLLLFHSVGVLVLNVSIRELKYYK